MIREQPGLLNSTLEELKALLRDLSTIEGAENVTIKSQIELEMRLHSAEEALDKTERVLSEKSEENKRLKEQINQLTSKSHSQNSGSFVVWLPPVPTIHSYSDVLLRCHS